MSTVAETEFDDCIRVATEDQCAGIPIQWSMQARAALSAHLIAWPERDVPHWFDNLVHQNLKATFDGHAC